ncbi:MAG: hypothetical protein QM594_01740 [Niabella sp.]
MKRYFSSCYPFLKIELYRMWDKNEMPQKKHIPVTYKFTGLLREGAVDINSDITVAELSNSFAAFGLRIEVFRKSGNVWVETFLTDSWTLQQQNKAGEEISTPA